MAKKIIGTVLGLLLVVGALVGIKVLQFKTMFAQQAHAAAPPEAVAVSPVRRDTLRPTLDAVGSITSAQGVTLKAEMPGPIRRIAFESGAVAKAGDILVELDAATEKAQLEAAEANAALVRVQLQSGRALVESGAIAQNQFITLQAQAKQADAEVARLSALVAKKTIRAPFAGILGLRLVNLGQFVGNGDPLVSLQALDPVFVDFALPQQRLAELKVGAPVHVTTDVFPGTQFEGALAAIHPEIDVATRSVRLRATLNNPQAQLKPGMFAKVEVVLPSTEQVLMVPATAVAYAPYGDSVYVLEKSKDGKGQVARQKFVRLGPARGDFVVVTKGLSADETVVTTGAFKLRNGAPVMINNDLKPDASDKPNPQDT
jgi:membrane fusion protein (multidrug efflux system)